MAQALKRLQESPVVVAVGSLTRCLQNESIVMVAMLSNCKHGSTARMLRRSDEEVQGKHLVPCPPCRTLQMKAESVIVGYALSTKCVTHYLSSCYPMNTNAEAIKNCPA